ncbi:MAG: hypothetical protein AB1345_06615 [Chloroflexota bacterium]
MPINIHTNTRLIRRNSLIGKYGLIGGMVILGLGVYVLIKRPEEVTLQFGVLIVGFMVSQIGIHFSNRWVRRPRPDEVLNTALKGLSDNYYLYHYQTPASHLLTGPAGIWVLLPLNKKGTIVYEKGRWQQKGGGFGLLYGKLFAQEGLGRPDIILETEIGALKDRLCKSLPHLELPPIQAALIFTSEAAVLQADDAPVPTLRPELLKKLIRKQAKETRLSQEKVEAIHKAFTTKLTRKEIHGEKQS